MLLVKSPEAGKGHAPTIPFQACACVNQPHVVCGEPFSVSPTFTKTFFVKVLDTYIVACHYSPMQQIRCALENEMSDDTLHTVSRLFLIFTIMVLAAACGSILAWPCVIGTTAACCLAVHRVATMGSR
jgi:hypothetical protein